MLKTTAHPRTLKRALIISPPTGSQSLLPIPPHSPCAGVHRNTKTAEVWKLRNLRNIQIVLATFPRWWVRKSWRLTSLRSLDNFVVVLKPPSFLRLNDLKFIVEDTPVCPESTEGTQRNPHVVGILKILKKRPHNVNKKNASIMMKWQAPDSKLLRVFSGPKASHFVWWCKIKAYVSCIG